MAGLLSVVLLVSLGYLLTHEAAAPDVDLMHGVPVAASQLPVMEAAFGKANLKEYKFQGTSIRVPRGQEATYMTALVDAKALPPNFGAAQREAVNGGFSLEIGSQRERERMRVAKQDDLALEICKKPGIESASVHLDVDKPGGFRDKVITALASVKPAGSGQLDEAQVLAIRRLVTGAIAGLKPENVTVADLNGPTWCGNSEDTGGASDNLYISLKRTYEQDLKAKILNALGFIPNVAVAVSVELDRERIIRTRQFKRAVDAAGDRQQSTSSASARDRDIQAGRARPRPTPQRGHGSGRFAGRFPRRRRWGGARWFRRRPRADREGKHWPDARLCQGRGERARQLLQEDLAGEKPGRAERARQDAGPVRARSDLCRRDGEDSEARGPAAPADQGRKRCGRRWSP